MKTRASPQVYFIGAGPGDPELLTIKGKKALARADVVIYADSLVHPGILRYARKHPEIHMSAGMSLPEVEEVMLKSAAGGKIVARIHSGDPSLYGAILEQLAFLEEHGISYVIIPGVSAVFAAAAALRTELTIPEMAQTVIISRLAGRTPAPESLKALAAHHTTLVLYLSVKEIQTVVTTLLEAGYAPDTPVAVVYRVTWQDEKRILGTLADIFPRVRLEGIENQALIMVGKAFGPELKTSDFARSRLYDASFSHGRRRSAANTKPPMDRNKQ